MRPQATSAARGLAADAIAAARVIAYDALPDRLLRACSTPLRYPLLAAVVAMVVASAALTVAFMHLAIAAVDVDRRPLLVAVVVVALTIGPAIRLSIGSTPALVVSVGTVAPLLRALDLGGAQRLCATLAAFVPVATASCFLGASASLSLRLVGEREAGGVVLWAAAAGIVAAAVIAGLTRGRPLVAGMIGRGLLVLLAGMGALVLVLGIGPQSQLLEVLPVRDASALRPLVVAVAIAPALWIAAEVLIRDARAPLRLARELVSCGSSALMLALLAVGGLAGLAMAAVPAALAVTLLAGLHSEALTVSVVAAHAVVVAGVVVLLEPQRQRVVARSALFVLLLVPAATAVAQATGAVTMPYAGVAVLALALSIAIGRLR